MLRKFWLTLPLLAGSSTLIVSLLMISNPADAFDMLAPFQALQDASRRDYRNPQRPLPMIEGRQMGEIEQMGEGQAAGGSFRRPVPVSLAFPGYDDVQNGSIYAAPAHDSRSLVQYRVQGGQIVGSQYHLNGRRQRSGAGNLIGWLLWGNDSFARPPRRSPVTAPPQRAAQDASYTAVSRSEAVFPQTALQKLDEYRGQRGINQVPQDGSLSEGIPASIIYKQGAVSTGIMQHPMEGGGTITLYLAGGNINGYKVDSW